MSDLKQLLDDACKANQALTDAAAVKDVELTARETKVREHVDAIRKMADEMYPAPASPTAPVPAATETVSSPTAPVVTETAPVAPATDAAPAASGTAAT